MKTFFILLSIATLHTVYAQKDIPDYSRGLPVPDAAEEAWFKENCEEIRGMHLNTIARARLAAEGKSVATMSFVPIGEEFVTDNTVVKKTTTRQLSLPSSVDNSTLKYFPPIRTQGSLGSCSAFSTVYYQSTHNTALARDIDVKNGDDTVRFSPKWTYNMFNGGANAGIAISTSMSMMEDHGIATWAEFPYEPYGADIRYREWSVDSNVWHHALDFRMSNYYTITYLYETNNLEQLKAVLANGYVVGFQSYSPWPYNGWTKGAVGNDPSTTNDDAYVGQDICKYVRSVDWGHAMTVVGYNDDIWCDLNGNGTVDTGEKGALKIANSWGTSFSESGFCWFAYDALHDASTVSGVTDPTDRTYGFGYSGGYGCSVYILKALSSYQPILLAACTVTHPKRNQMSLRVGKGDVGDTSPDYTWWSTALTSDGGAYAFDGSDTCVTSTFYLDFADTDLDFGVTKRYFVSFNDSASGSETGRLLSYTLSDELTGYTDTITPATDAAQFSTSGGVADGGYAYAWIDYSLPEPGFVCGLLLCAVCMYRRRT